jgi:hypothetical protein
MKLKTLGRINGFLHAAPSGYLLKLSYDSFLDTDTRIIGAAFDESLPLEYRAPAALYAISKAGAALCSAAVSLVFIDGVVDMYKGTGHYFGLELVKRFSKDQARKEKIEKEQAETLSVLDKTVDFRKFLSELRKKHPSSQMPE